MNTSPHENPSTFPHPGLLSGLTPPVASPRAPAALDTAMMHCQNRLMEAMSSDLPSESHIFSCLQQAAETLGFPHVSCIYQASLPVGDPEWSWLNNYPDAWRQHYATGGHALHDPRLLRARRSSTPFSWNEQLFADAPELWNALDQFGMGHGWTQSILDEPGGISMITLSRATPLSQQELQTHQQHLRWLGLLAHQAFSRVLHERTRQRAPALTQRETEVLKWTADGKSAQDIAEILLLSKNTVDFHIKNSIRKLNVPNKTAAVVRAVLMGMIH